MDDNELLARIEVNPAVMVGKPVIRGTRLPVEFILGLLAAGASYEEILGEYYRLDRLDILACIAFARRALKAPPAEPLAAR